MYKLLYLSAPPAVYRLGLGLVLVLVLRCNAIAHTVLHVSQNAINTRNKSNDYFESMQHRQDLFAITHYQKRKHFPSCTRCSKNHNSTCAENRKIRGLKFDTLSKGAQLQIIPYKKPPKHFLNLHGLIDFRCAQTLALPCVFGTTATS